ncbi:SymE family type I addiction module toxin [Dyadobacter sp. CY323]|uniref:SymE family type I addiction module toxin n=1 Tax=Dyadobacter sp. CY323 TaxID=2907302 RepID=UPI001F2D7D15|nr:SymE family type I addiction module toxin [Dyadobacter sp. CY323]MCE6991300.1 type I toxin-antitoxin system SymE family toxin [Dyadobacter sp. CY323]
MRNNKPKTAKSLPAPKPKILKPKRPDVRSLSIQAKLRRNVYEEKSIPEIKLCGEWLRNLGFEFGEKVKITTMHQLLIIQPL